MSATNLVVRRTNGQSLVLFWPDGSEMGKIVLSEFTGQVKASVHLDQRIRVKRGELPTRPPGPVKAA